MQPVCDRMYGSQIFVYVSACGPKHSSPDPTGLTANITDGAWHMVTVTTLPGGGRGYQLYVDGQLAGQLPSIAAAGASQCHSHAPCVTAAACMSQRCLSQLV